MARSVAPSSLYEMMIFFKGVARAGATVGATPAAAAAEAALLAVGAASPAPGAAHALATHSADAPPTSLSTPRRVTRTRTDVPTLSLVTPLQVTGIASPPEDRAPAPTARTPAPPRRPQSSYRSPPTDRTPWRWSWR